MSRRIYQCVVTCRGLRDLGLLSRYLITGTCREEMKIIAEKSARQDDMELINMVDVD